MRVRALPRQGGEFTCMSRMMRFVSDKIVPQIPAKAVKVVLDVSGDGRDNCNEQEPVEKVRDELVSYGVTVNGLPILEGNEGEGEGPGGVPTQSYLPPGGRSRERQNPARGLVPRPREGRPGLVRAAGQRLFRFRPRHPPEVRARGQQPVRRRAAALARATRT